MESPSEVLLSGHKVSHWDMYQNTILDKWFSTTSFSFSLELLEQVRKYLPLLLFFCISKQIFKLFYVRTSPLALKAVLPSVVNAAVVPRAALPPLLFPNAHRQAAASPHTVSKGHVLIRLGY